MNQRWDDMIRWLGLPAFAALAFLAICMLLLLLAMLGLFNPSTWVRLYMLMTLVMSAVEFVFYGIDKRAAVAESQRISEKRLLVIAALCGWPGAVLAARFFRHKTIKPSFRRNMMLVVFAHIGLITLVIVDALGK